MLATINIRLNSGPGNPRVSGHPRVPEPPCPEILQTLAVVHESTGMTTTCDVVKSLIPDIDVYVIKP
jgi:hypothetical protein